MENKTVVVIGGVAGGMSFATRYRRLNQNDKIIVLDKGPYVSFANCGLPYHISNEIEQREDLLVAKQSMLEDRFKLDVRVNHEVIKINEQGKSVVVKTMNGLEEIQYDTLILSVGAQAIQLDISGIESHKAIFTLRNIPDMDAIIASIEKYKHKSAVVIGAGFIGLEMAEALKHRGLNVSVVEKAPHVLPPLDIEMATMAQHVLNANDITTYTNTSIVNINNNIATLEDGEEINADLIIMAVGVRPATAFLNNTNIELGFNGGIVVDKQFKTSVKDIYAVGDAMITYNAINQQAAIIALAAPANRQGRQLADSLSGIEKANKGSIATAIVRLFDMSFAATGLNERMLDRDQIEIIHLKANDHAGYFPNATPISLKVIFDKQTHKILGAQAYGRKGVDKRIDIIATAIRAGMLVTDLQDLELAYAPPFGSAKDIVNMVGYVAENIILKITHPVQWYDVESYQNNTSKIIVDVRNLDEIEEGRIAGALSMPLDTLRHTMNELPLDKEILVYCASGVRAYNAETILRNAGYKVKNLDGAYGLYEMMNRGE